MQTHLSTLGFTPNTSKLRYTKKKAFLECPFCYRLFSRRLGELSICPYCNTCFKNIDILDKNGECRIKMYQRGYRTQKKIWEDKKRNFRRKL